MKEVFKMKKIKRILCTLFAVMTMAITFCFGAVTASASASETVATPVTVINPINAAIELPAVPDFSYFKMNNNNNNDGDKKTLDGVSGDLTNQTDGDEQWNQTVSIFVKWIGRIGGLVAFVGAIMFAFAFKKNDADMKEAALWTLAAGFMAAALCGAVDMFGITA